MSDKLQNTSGTLAAKRHLTNEVAILEVYGKMGRIHCRMSNLSESGAFFQILNSTFTPRAADFVRIKVQLRQLNKSHTLHGQIVWAKGLGLGIHFIRLPELVEKINK